MNPLDILFEPQRNTKTTHCPNCKQNVIFAFSPDDHMYKENSDYWYKVAQALLEENHNLKRVINKFTEPSSP